MTYRGKNKAGFTLIELLVAITIIGILAAIGLSSYSAAQRKARDARRKSDLQSVARALELYYNDHGAYPLSDGTEGVMMACDPGSRSKCSWGGPFTSGGVNYMQVLPSDPYGRYFYTSGDGTGYYLLARLENTDDSQAMHIGNSPASRTGTLCRDSGHMNCNYGISSTNGTIPPPDIEE